MWEVKGCHNRGVPTELALVLRLLLAAALGAALGAERETHDQPAGFRTHLLVATGSALFAIISAYGFQAIVGNGPPQMRADVTRVASQIVVGIGFLGGGAILKYGATVRGLTTAASLWVTAAVGTAIGVGMLALGSITALIALSALFLLRPVRSLIRRRATEHEEFLVEAGHALRMEDLLRGLSDARAQLDTMNVQRETDALTVTLHAKVPAGVLPETVVETLSKVEHVRDVGWTR